MSGIDCRIHRSQLVRNYLEWDSSFSEIELNVFVFLKSYKKYLNGVEALSWPSVQLIILSSEPCLKPNDPLDLRQIQMRLIKIKGLKINITFKCRLESNSYQVLHLIFLKDSGGIVGTLSGVTIHFYLLSVERKMPAAK